MKKWADNKRKQFIHSRFYLPVTLQTVGLGRLVHNQTRLRSQKFCCYFINSSVNAELKM